jgi:superfamily II DNA/RNA helicase
MSAPDYAPETNDLSFTEAELTELAVATYTEAVGAEAAHESAEPAEPTEPAEAEAVSNVFTGLPPELIEALRQQGIVTPTAVQEAVIPDGMAGHDVLGRAQTGSGKTLAFGIPALAKLAGRKSRPCHPRAVMIVPTRELANQVAQAIQPLAHAMNLKMVTVYGGTPYDKQTRQLRQRADIVVATPGRLEDLLENGYCFFDDIQLTVLDEADHLCDLGFYPSVDKLVGMTPEGSQRMLLSATLDGDVDKLVRTHLRNPKLHELDPNSGSVTTMTHHTLTVGGFREKVGTAVRLVEANGRTIIFTRTREGAVELAEALTGQGVEAVDLHGNLSQKVRERNLHRFSSGKAKAVVATDVAARGIHVDAVDMVIHFDAASDAKAYLHRSGRTARAGRDGAVVTITTPKFLQQVVRLQQNAGVEVLHHDIQTAPDHLSAAALAKHGGPAPKSSSSSYAGKRPQRSGGYKGSNPRAGYKSGGGYQSGGQKTGAPSYGKGKSYAGKRATAAR